MSRLTVSGLWKGYGEQPVLRASTSMSPAGSLTAVLGLSGCGKTTLLRVIAGFERAATRPRLARRSHRSTTAAPMCPRSVAAVGYVPQEGALFPHLSVEANVGFGLSRRERGGGTVGDLLEMVGIGALAKRHAARALRRRAAAGRPRPRTRADSPGAAARRALLLA